LNNTRPPSPADERRRTQWRGRFRPLTRTGVFPRTRTNEDGNAEPATRGRGSGSGEGSREVIDVDAIETDNEE